MTVYKTTSRNINNLKDKIIPNNTVVLYYYSDKCPYCIMMKGLINELYDNYSNNKKIILILINREQMLKLDKRMHIDLVPTFIAYKNGNKISEFQKKREYNYILNFINKFENN